MPSEYGNPRERLPVVKPKKKVAPELAPVARPMGVRGREADIPIPTRGDHRRQRIREITDKVIFGDLQPLEARNHYQALGLSEREKKYLFDYSSRKSDRVQKEVDRKFNRSIVNILGSAATLPLLGQSGAETLGAVRENVGTLAGAHRHDAAPASLGDAGLQYGMVWMPGKPSLRTGRGLLRTGPRSNEDLQKLAGEAAPPVEDAAAKVVGSLGEAKKLRGQQEKLYRAERGARGGAAEEAAAKTGGQAGYHAALSELKGELPKLKFGALEGELDQPTVDRLFDHITAQDLRPYEKMNARRALSNALEGRVPTRGDIRMLGRVFGPDTAAQIKASVPFWAKAKNAGLQIINVPRSLRASYDLSAPFRQGLVLGARHPRMFAREFGPMLKSFASEGAYKDVMDDIVSRPTFETMQKAKLALTDLENLSTREEQFMSNLAEHIPVAGRGVRASGRAYTAFLNKFRADAFDNYLNLAEKQGLDTTDEHLLKSIATWVNNATGRGGSSKTFLDHAVGMNALLFSPRLIASRLNLLLNPKFYADLNPFARKQAVRGMAQLLGGVSLTLWLAKMAGAQVGMDPRSANFGKIRLGNTRIDVMGGFQQYMVAAARLVKGETVSSTSGELTQLKGGFGGQSRADIMQRIVEGKLAPVPAYLNQWAKNENFAGDPFNPYKEAGKMLLPLGFEGTYDTYRQTGSIPATAGGFGLNAVGFGVQTYGPKKPKRGKGKARGRADHLAPIPRP